MLVQVHFGMQRIKGESECHASQCVPSTIHFVESAPSILREMPWILIKDSTVNICNCSTLYFYIQFDIIRIVVCHLMKQRGCASK